MSWVLEQEKPFDEHATVNIYKHVDDQQPFTWFVNVPVHDLQEAMLEAGWKIDSEIDYQDGQVRYTAEHLGHPSKIDRGYDVHETYCVVNGDQTPSCGISRIEQ